MSSKVLAIVHPAPAGNISASEASLGLRLCPVELPNDLKAGQIRVRLLAAPVNVLDILVLRGLYPVKPAHQIDGKGVPGYDGVGQVEAVASGVNNITTGTLVLPRAHGFGTWRTHAIVDSTEVLAIPNSRDPILCSHLKMVFTPAYILLNDMCKLRPGDWVVLNAATGRIARALMQFARLQGIKVLAVIRSRNDVESVKQELLALGASRVHSEEEIRDLLASSKSSLPGRVKLAIDGVFGISGLQLVNLLAPGGTYVSMGYLNRGSEQPFTLALTEEHLFGKTINFRSFRLSKELSRWTDDDVAGLYQWIMDLAAEQKLVVHPLQIVNWEDALEGITTTQDLEKAVQDGVDTVASGKGDKIVFQLGSLSV